MPATWKPDVRSYFTAFGVLARHPQICVGPLLASAINVLILSVVPEGGGGLIGLANLGIVGILTYVIGIAGLAVAIVGADLAWRGRRATFEEAASEIKRRGTDVLIAAIGFSFLASVAGMIGGALGFIGTLALTAVVSVFCIYMIPAAAIGGIPGGATLEISIQRVRSSPASALLIALVYFAGTTFGPTLIIYALQPLLFSATIFSSGVVSSLIVGVVRAVFTGYVALVLAKAYADASYGRFRSY